MVVLLGIRGDLLVLVPMRQAPPVAGMTERDKLAQARRAARTTLLISNKLGYLGHAARALVNTEAGTPACDAATMVAFISPHLPFRAWNSASVRAAGATRPVQALRFPGFEHSA
jgi:hypothetical protein